MLKHQSSQALVDGEQTAKRVPAITFRRWISFPSIRTSAGAIPLILGGLYVLIAVLLVVVDLAQPAQQPGFPGIRFSNTVNSPGSRAIVAMYRDHLGWLPRPSSDEPLSPTQYIWGLRTLWIAMIAIQIAALWASRQTKMASLKVWIIGPAIACFVFLLYPPTSTDIYAYSSFGWVAERGENPYLVAPESIPGDPYASFNDWTHVRSPYGPIWTGISRTIVHVTNEDPFWTTIGFKVVATLPAFGLALLTYRLARRFTNDERLALTAFIFIWWSPILITESAATVHLDPLVMFLAMLGLAYATGRGFRSHRLGVALVVASALVKPISLPLIALLILARIAGKERLAVVFRQMALDVLLVAAMAAAAFAPFWDRNLIHEIVENSRVLYTDRPLRSNPLWVWGLDHIDALLGVTKAVGGDAGSATRWIAIALTAIATVVYARALLRQRRESVGADDPVIAQATFRFLVWAWAAVTVIIGILPVNAHPWYVIWPMPLLALLWISDGWRDRTRPPGWLLALQGWIFLSFVIYHTLPKR